MKKLIGLFLVAAIVCGTFTGCPLSGKESKSSDDPNKEVTLKIALPWSEQKDTKSVVEEINKKLKDLLPNTKIELMLDPSLSNKWSLWMAAKKEIDIAHSGFDTNIEDEVRKESYLELNKLVEDNAPNIKKLRDEYWYSYNNSSINGKLYAIPNIQTHLKETLMLRIWKAGSPYCDVAALNAEAYRSDKTTRKFWDILTQGVENAAAHGVDCASIVNLTIYQIAQRGYNFIGGADSNFCYDNSDSGKIIDFYTTQEFKDFCDVMKTWAAKGWISKDILTGKWADKLYCDTDSRYKMDPKTGIQENLTYDPAIAPVIFDLNDPEKDIVTTNIGENRTYYSIPFTAANPNRAMKFLDLINSEEGKVISNMLAYGIEGKHYEFVNKENGEIKANEYKAQGSASTTYGIPNWMCGNMLLQYSVQPFTHDEITYAKDYYLNRAGKLKKHILYGMSFDVESFRNEFSKIMKNNGDYAKSIYSGVIQDTDKLMQELTEKNKSAGYDKVMKELQKQADEHIASKK